MYHFAMLRVITGLIIIYSLVFIPCYCMGDEVAETSAKKSIKIDKEAVRAKAKNVGDKMYAQKEKTRQRIKYFKQKKHIEILENRRNKKQQEIEYLEKRLELKKNQLESFDSDTEKGEKVK